MYHPSVVAPGFQVCQGSQLVVITAWMGAGKALTPQIKSGQLPSESAFVSCHQRKAFDKGGGSNERFTFVE